jgi:hypothetical protein
MTKFQKVILIAHRVIDGAQALHDIVFKSPLKEKEPIKGLVKTIPTPLPDNDMTEMVDDIAEFVSHCHEHHGPIDKKYLN